MVRIAVIGGYGRMGRIFAKMFSEDGHDVTICGPDKKVGTKTARELGVGYEKENWKAVEKSDVTIITVPIKKTVSVIREIAPHTKERSLLMDLTSVKIVPCKAMDESAKKSVEVLGCHPLFGPADDLTGQNVLICPIRRGKLTKWMIAYLTKKGFVLSELTPDEHDRAMAVVQGLLHSVTIAYGKVLENKVKGDLSRLLIPKGKRAWEMSKVYRSQRELVDDIRELNPYSEDAARTFIKKFEDVSCT